jgi:inner membrane protein
MTGKTHVVIGLAIIFSSGRFIQPTSIKTYPDLLLHNALPASTIIQLVAIVAVVWLGSLAPDLDQPGSTLSRDIGGPLGRTKASALLGGLGLLYLSSHMSAILNRVPYLEVGFVILGCILLMMAILKHRGLTHSLLGIALMGIAVHWGLLVLKAHGVSFAPSLFLPFLIGYAAHLVADSFTISGIAPFYLPFFPKTQKHWHFPLHIRTGEFVDTVVLRIGAIVFIAIRFVR